jgi:hypothetical protein
MNKPIEQWLNRAKAGVEVNSKALWPNCSANHETLAWTEGKKYIRVVVRYLEDKIGSGSSYCFIDQEGNIYKSAGFSTPAKGIRGTIDSVDPNKLDGSTDWLYRK